MFRKNLHQHNSVGKDMHCYMQRLGFEPLTPHGELQPRGYLTKKKIIFRKNDEYMIKGNCVNAQPCQLLQQEHNDNAELLIQKDIIMIIQFLFSLAKERVYVIKQFILCCLESLICPCIFFSEILGCYCFPAHQIFLLQFALNFIFYKILCGMTKIPLFQNVAMLIRNKINWYQTG